VTRRSAEAKSGFVVQPGFLLILGQLILIALLVRVLDMQTSAFRRVVYVSIPGFAVHHLLPPRLRLRFFAAFSIGALALVMGGADGRLWDPTLALFRTAVILAYGAALIGICLLPIGFWKRAGLLAAAGGLAALFRAGIVGLPPLAIVWPVLAAMFMFRTFVYLYDVSTSPKRPSLGRSLSYFFVIFNACCLLFPVIDFKAFWRRYYDEEPLVIYQRGVRWMGRGILHLLLYRIVDQLLSVQATDVTNGTQLVQFVVSNLLLYLNVSGQFHFIVGTLLLFGFNLPETNHRYFLASSFTDYWRRVNIYWKDFMMKVFYYPTFFRLKRLGTAWALVIATVVVFAVTWVLHAYQTWWLKGTVSVTLTDALFWAILGLLVLFNALWELKSGRQRRLSTRRYSVREAISLSLRTAATFAVIGVLWSLWSTESLSLWIHVWSLADRYTLLWGAAVMGAVMIATVFFEVLPGLDATAAGLTGPSIGAPRKPGVEAARCAALLVAMLLVGYPLVRAQLVPIWLQPFRDALAAGDSLGNSEEAQGRGYYESLKAFDEANRQLWETLRRERLVDIYTGNNPVRRVRDFRFREPLPLVHVWAYSTDFRTNRWGMRDRDVSITRSPGTLRIALQGSSHVMGWGVPENRIFKASLEEALNRGRAGANDAPRFEILNFAFNGLSPLGQISVVEARAGAFRPHLALFIAHTFDYEWTVRDVSRCLREGVPLDDATLRETLAKAHIAARTHPSLADERLKPFAAELVAWSYRGIVEKWRSVGTLPIFVFVPLPTARPPQQRIAEQLSLAERAGFVCLDLTHVFDGHDTSDLVQRDYYRHMNLLAHDLVADELARRLTSDPRIDLWGRARAVLAADQALARLSSQ
jgi:alginate O-acetyltransferase complex protein AlgI